MEQASRKGYDGIVGALLKAQADPNKGMQPAVEARMLSTIKLLVENGAKPNPAMPLAAEVGDQPWWSCSSPMAPTPSWACPSRWIRGTPR
ncbi:MAG: hypothetical protein IPF41_15725 [Flavobacteriales bacterium]|nr:hypothetical protein [Flavobacteriales bacterium]